jgi:PAS domain S-box-containing protein
MSTKILEYIDFEKVNTVLEGFNQSSGFVTAILDLEGNILSKSGWRKICTDFHRTNSETSKRCAISDTILAGKMGKGEKFHAYKCLNGLIDVAVPIIIKGEHIANLFSGQFFFEKPDYSFFQKQAAEFGFNESAYLKALQEVPIISEEKVKVIMEFLLNMTQLISDMTLQRLELIQLNNTLQESEERLRFSLEGANDGIWDVNMETNEVYISPRGCEILGYLPSEMHEIAKVWSDLVCPDDLQHTNEILQQYLSGNKPIFEIEQRLKLKSGEYKWVLTRGKVIAKNNLGQPMRMTGTHTDISYKKEDELIKIQTQQLLKQQNDEYLRLNEELNKKNEAFLLLNENLRIAKERAEESETNLHTILSSTNDIIASYDLNIRLLTFNKACSNIYKSLFGIEIYPGLCTLDLFPESTRDFWKLNNSRAIAGETFSIEINLPTANGELIFEQYYNPIFKDGKVVCFSTFTRDITEKKRIEFELIKAKEKAEESDRLKTAFLQNMSHEIRTPMNAIMGFSDLLLQNADNKTKLKNFTSIINQRCNDLLNIINDILDISKIESGQVPIHLEETNLNELFTELTSFFNEYQNRISKQHIKLSLQSFCTQKPNMVITDKVKLKQIFINLIGNAFKFTNEGKIGFGCKLDEDHNLLFYVSDTGPGIPLEKQQFIFERFTQLHDNSKMNIGGTGLGLPIVKALVGLLGGHVGLNSEVGKGSTFYFTIPYNPVQEISPKADVFEYKNDRNFAGKTILIVEDDPYNAEYLKEVISGFGITILHTGNGEEAIEISLNQEIDLILMDIRLPNMDGYEAIRQIKQHKEYIKIVAQTAYATQDEKQKALRYGCVDYVSKPTKLCVLASLFNKHL